ncbi:MAG: ribose-phosphate diphosphokinase, partial [Alphaproteobacteria bacterium]|nr:ribose-phosphate diphosphokinase [Alphaproteobacteria bacterium]
MKLRTYFYVVVCFFLGIQGSVADLSNCIFLAGSGNPELASKICDQLGVNLVDAGIERFKNGEIAVTLKEAVREKDVFIIAAFIERDTMSVNDQLIEFQLLADAARRAGAHRIFAMFLNYPYARQDRRSDKRAPISASMVANMVENVGHVKRLVTIDLHAEQIQGFFQSTGVDNISSGKLFAEHMATLNLGPIVVVSPDAGGAKRAETFKDYLAHQGVTSDFAMMIKKRLKANEVESVQLVGDVKGKVAIIIDD